MPFSGKKTIKNKDVSKQYARIPSISDYLPWKEWSEEHSIMLLEDNRSVGASFEIRDIPTEAQPEDIISGLHKRMTAVLSSVVPLHEENPWVVEFFFQDDMTLEPLYERLKSYIAEKGKLDDPLAQKYLQTMREHFKLMCRDEGLFIDPMNGLPYRGRIRRIRMNVYRRYSNLKNISDVNVVEELESIIQNIENRLSGAQISIRRLVGRQLYEWWVRWFNPKPASTNGDQDKLLEKFPYPAEHKPFGWSFDQNIFFGDIESDDKNNWLFDGVLHKVMVFRELQNTIDIGVISREKKSGFGSGSSKSALFDEMPPGTIYTIKIVFEGKNTVVKHLADIDKSSIGGDEMTIAEIENNARRAKYEMDNGNMLFRTTEAIYFNGKNEAEIQNRESLIRSRLEDAGLMLIDTKNEVFPLDNYLRFLPFNFDYKFDKENTYRSTYKFADDVARLLPIYGRTRGDGRFPLFVYYNRGGEPFIFDPLNKQFKMSNSHMAIVGTTGSGKSVTLNNLIESFSAVYNPRIIALEVGDSFGLTAKYLKAHGRSVHSMKFKRQSPIPVNPYAEAYVALEMVEREEEIIRQNAIKERADVGQATVEEIIAQCNVDKVQDMLDHADELATEEELGCEDDRDILNEMILATRTMITGGIQAEEDKITRADTMLMSKALIHSMKRCRDAGIPQMLVQHVAESCRLLSSTESNVNIGERYAQFSLNMEEYQKGLKGQFINKASEPLSDYDFMQIDFGFMQNASQYQDLMNIVCISLLAKILALAEAGKSSGRPTILIIDEAHVFFKSPMVAAFLILMAKVARKIGLWLIPCTQNINDFSGVESRKVLSMMETWLCLALDKEEVKLVEQFKPLSAEVKSLILDIEKHQGIYSEGVLLGKRYFGLFRNIPPRINLALAMTEQDERTERKNIMKKKGIGELEAVEYIAEKLKNVSVKKTTHEDFF